MDSAVKFIKHRLRMDHTTFIGHTAEYNQIKELISRTSENGESNSALVIGPLGCGKTTVSTPIRIAHKPFRAPIFNFLISDGFIDFIASSDES